MSEQDNIADSTEAERIAAASENLTEWETGSWGNAWVEATIVNREPLNGQPGEVVILSIIGYLEAGGMTDEAYREDFWADAGVDVIERIRALKDEADRLDGGWL